MYATRCGVKRNGCESIEWIILQFPKKRKGNKKWGERKMYLESVIEAPEVLHDPNQWSDFLLVDGSLLIDPLLEHWNDWDVRVSDDLDSVVERSGRRRRRRRRWVLGFGREERSKSYRTSWGVLRQRGNDFTHAVKLFHFRFVLVFSETEKKGFSGLKFGIGFKLCFLRKLGREIFCTRLFSFSLFLFLFLFSQFFHGLLGK